ncbi:MAG: uridine kinase [Acidobacteria bacterium]|nr:uridine kinase [Acidobacteriota bacterium]
MIIGICGGTGSGKTTVTKKVVEKVGAENVLLIEQDSYYIDLAVISLEERRLVNFDHPDSVDFDSIAEHLTKLKNGEAVEIPVYDFATHTRKAETLHTRPKPIIILEGILIFSQPQIAELLDVKIFIDTPADIRLMRRVRRDIQERSRTPEQTLAQYENTIRPMHKKFVEPSKDEADIIIPDGGESEIVLEQISGLVRGKLLDEGIAIHVTGA